MDAARALVCYQGKQHGLEYPATYHRIGECRYQRLGDLVGIKLTPENRAFYAGLATCGSVWACPVCTALIQEGRRKEIAQAIDWAYPHGFQPVLITLTFPHRHWQSLAELIEGQSQALKYLRNGSPWQRFKEKFGYQGHIRSLELTHGVNGWHPHTHELFLLSSTAKAADVLLAIADMWLSACVRAGLVDLSDVDQVRDFRAYAVDVKGNCSASDYLAKQDDSRHWGVDRELAKASTKAGRAKGEHPFGLLAIAAEGGKQAGAKYLEYIEVMKGRRQLVWSPRLKARVGVRDATDAELACDQQFDIPQLVCLFDAGHWARVLAKHQRAQLLLTVEKSHGDVAAVLAFLERLRL